EGLEALDERSDRGERAIGTFLGCAGECGLQLVAERREFLQIPCMGKPCAQARFVVPELTLGDGEVAGGLVALRRRGAEEAFDRVQDGARAVHISGEWGIPR